MNMVNVKVNGIAVSVPEGSTILEAARTRLKLGPERFPHNIEETGNTSSASIPILLDKLNREGALQNGERMILSAFGAGLCTGTALLEWNA